MFSKRARDDSGIGDMRPLSDDELLEWGTSLQDLAEGPRAPRPRRTRPLRAEPLRAEP